MKPAFVVIDMNIDFFEESPALMERKDFLVKNINDLAAYFRDKKIPVIWIRQEFKADLSDVYLFMKKTGRRVTIQGTRGAGLLDELDKRTQDLVIVKNRYSAFFKTELEKFLATNKIDTLVLAGINTHACVRMTAIDAYERDIEVMLAEDCVESWDREHHDITLRYFEKSMGIEALSNEQLKNKF